MNEVFLIGFIKSDIKFDFLINSKKLSISIFKIISINGQSINIKAYNKLADYCYRNLRTNCKVFIYGELRNNYVLIKEIRIL